MKKSLTLTTGTIILILGSISLCIAEKIPTDVENFSLQVGEKFTVLLPSNPTTGYDWYMLVNQPPDKRIIEIIDSTYKQHSPGRIGGSGSRALTFKAVKPTGTTSSAIPLYYCRPQSGNITKIKTLSVSIKELKE